MSISSHLESLNTRHGQLDAQIQREMRSPLPDSLKVAELKKQKLQIKDTITAMGPQARD